MKMVRQVKGYRVLEGLRGEEGVDLEALREAILRISQLVGDFPSINELDINPFVSFPTGRLSMAMDARIVLASSRPGAG